MRLKRRAFIRIISYSTIFIIALSIFGIYNYFASQTYKRYIANNYMRGFSDLASYVSNIDSSLQKVMYASSTPQFISLSNSIWRDSGAAQTSLEQLPVYDANLQNLSAFLSQTGDYSYYLAKKIAKGEELSQEDKDNISKLSSTATDLSNYLISLQSEINDGRITISEIKYTMLKKEPADTGNDIATFTGNMVKAEEQIGDTPKLIYDGPFSEHIETMTPKYLAGKAEISREEAKNKVAELLGKDPSTLTDTPDSGDKITTYNFNNTTYNISVTKIGGFVSEINDSREIKEPTISTEQALEKAKAFLSKMGLSGMVESYYMTENNRITFNFASKQDDVILYPDLIKVSIALDNGDIVGMSSLGYIMSHQDSRDITVTVSKETAQKELNKDLTVDDYRLAIIPSDGENEILCHEFKCISADNKTFLVYVNAKTGDIEDMLILLETPGGVLTM